MSLKSLETNFNLFFIARRTLKQSSFLYGFWALF